MIPVSVAMIAKNAQDSIESSLQSLTGFDEVLLYLNNSTDNTKQIAAAFPNVTIVEGEFIGFGPTKNRAADAAKHDWIFSLDSDEHVTPELLEELEQISLSDGNVYEVRRDNYYNGQHIKCCGWFPETIIRLYNRKMTNYNDAMVHERMETKNLNIQKLSHPINHYSFHSVGDFLDKIQKYSEIYANDHKGKKSSSIAKAILRGKSMFFKSYLLKGGWRCGFEGFVISFFAGLGTMVKYLKLREKNLYDR